MVSHFDPFSIPLYFLFFIFLSSYLCFFLVFLIDGKQSIPNEVKHLVSLANLDLSLNNLNSMPLVVCELSTRLSSLALIGNQLETLPPEISRLVGLRKLDLQCNRLAWLPEEIGALTQLRTLQLRQNALKTLPIQLAQCTALSELNVGDNALVSLSPFLDQDHGLFGSLRVLQAWNNQLTALPPSIGRLSQLVELDVSQNQLQALPADLSGLRVLERLSLFRNQLTSLPASLGACEALVELNLFGNQLISLPPQIGQLHRLRKLILTNNLLESLPREIGDCSSLVSLEVALNHLSSLPEELFDLTALQELNLASNLLPQLPESISRLSRLCKLHVAYNRMLDLPEGLQALQQLRELWAGGNPFRDGRMPAVLPRLSQLRELQLSCARLRELPHEVGSLVSLATLVLSGNLLQTLPPEIGRLSSLSELDVSHNMLIELPAEFGRLVALTDLDLSGNRLQELPAQFASLTRLHLLKLAANRLSRLPPLEPNVLVRTWISCECNEGLQTSGMVVSGGPGGSLRPAKVTRGPRWQPPALRSRSLSRAERTVPLVGWAEARGRRPEQQDTLSVVLNFRELSSEHYVGLFDGHAGVESATFAASYLHGLLAEALAATQNDWDRALRDAFAAIHAEIVKRSIQDGSAALVAVLQTQARKLHVANAGDSRAVLCRGGQIVPLTVDHKPESLQERERIRRANGFVTEARRVNGLLALTRSLGDAALQPAVTHEPDVTHFNLRPEDEYLILACDGLWDVVNNDEVPRIIGEERPLDPARAAIRLRDHAILMGSSDNVSALVVSLAGIV
jgi:Leucine-rich repeat (LRR) protein/serine/threonine protein phosphatase PrpC